MVEQPCSLLPPLLVLLLIVIAKMPSNMPWERVRGDVLRALVKELGLKSFGLKREEMVELLEAVERDGSTYIRLFICLAT